MPKTTEVTTSPVENHPGEYNLYINRVWKGIVTHPDSPLAAKVEHDFRTLALLKNQYKKHRKQMLKQGYTLRK
jgi:hypothetical protein